MVLAPVLLVAAVAEVVPQQLEEMGSLLVLVVMEVMEQKQQ